MGVQAIRIQRFFLALIVGVFSLGCFPQGLPEYVLGQRAVPVGTSAGARARQLSVDARGSRAMRSPVFIVAGAPDSPLLTAPPEEGGQILGFQYVLGFIPFTRLYYQRGVERFSHELLADLLFNQGASPFVVPARVAPLAAMALSPRQMMSIRVADPSVQGFDAFFFRYLSVNADLELRLLNLVRLQSGASELVEGFRLSERVSDSAFKQYAHGPALSFMLEKTLLGSMKKMLHEMPLPSRHSRAGREPLVGAPSLVVMTMPSLQEAPTKEFGRLVAASYGYAARRGYSDLSLSRMVQRGMSYVAEERGLPFAVMLHQGIPFVAPGKRLVLMEVEIAELGFVNGSGNSDDRVRLLAEVRTSELRSGGRKKVLLRKRCVVSKAPDGDIDGSWVDALERAGEDILKAYFAVSDSDTDAVEARCESAATSGQNRGRQGVRK